MLPVLMLIILGILYFGRYESYSTQMTQLAEQGARDAAVDYQVPAGTVVGTQNCVTGASAPTLSGTAIPNNLACFIASQATGELAGSGSADVQALQVNVQCGTGTAAVCAAGSNVTVCTKATVQFPFLPIKAGTIYQSATMRVETAGTAGSTSPYPVTDSYESTTASSTLC